MGKKIFYILYFLEFMADLEALAEAVYKISGGEQQRTAIARAMVSGCKYILADEPTGALDSMTAVELMKLFQMMHEEGKTILVVTHDNQVAGYAQKTIMISDGKIESIKENK